MRERASAVIIRDNTVLLICRENEKGLYYVFPGGGVEEGESIEEAVVRELKEEAGITILAQKILSTFSTTWGTNTLVLCQEKSKEEPVWLETHKQSVENKYKFEWVEGIKLKNINLLPEKSKEIVERLVGV